MGAPRRPTWRGQVRSAWFEARGRGSVGESRDGRIASWYVAGAALAVVLCALALTPTAHPASRVATAAPTPSSALAGLKALDAKLTAAVTQLRAQATTTQKLSKTQVNDLLSGLLDGIDPSVFVDSVFGVSPALLVFNRLYDLDATLNKANADRGDPHDLARDLETFRSGVASLKAVLKQGAGVPDEVGTDLDALSTDAGTLGSDAAAGKLDDAAIAKQIGALKDAKISMLTNFPPVLGASFQQVFLNWERVRQNLTDAMTQNDTYGPRALTAVIADLEAAIRYKQAIETLISDANPGASAPPTTTSKQTTAPPTPSSAFKCVGPEFNLVPNDSNGDTVGNGGTPPTFSTGGKSYCLVSISTYHWNDGQGAAPGTIGLTSGSGVKLGPWKATSSVGQATERYPGGVPNAGWTVNVPASPPVLISGTYTCNDSEPATWSQNSGTGSHGFCKVWVEQAVPAGG